MRLERAGEPANSPMELARAVYPSLADDADFLRWHVDYHRTAASPGAAAEFFRMLRETDVSNVLQTIRVPTLILFREVRRAAALRVARLSRVRWPRRPPGMIKRCGSVMRYLH